jgi:hypothetical protein
MPIHVQPIVANVRFYSEGKSFESQDAYDAVATIQFIGRKVFLGSMHGNITIDMLVDFFNYVYKMDCEEVIAIRRGKTKIYSKKNIEKFLKKYNKID